MTAFNIYECMTVLASRERKLKSRRGGEDGARAQPALHTSLRTDIRIQTYRMSEEASVTLPDTLQKIVR